MSVRQQVIKRLRRENERSRTPRFILIHPSSIANKQRVSLKRSKDQFNTIQRFLLPARQHCTPQHTTTLLLASLHCTLQHTTYYTPQQL